VKTCSFCPCPESAEQIAPSLDNSARRLASAKCFTEAGSYAGVGQSCRIGVIVKNVCFSARLGRKIWNNRPRDAEILSSFEIVNYSNLAVYVRFFRTKMRDRKFFQKFYIFLLTTATACRRATTSYRDLI